MRLALKEVRFFSELSEKMSSDLMNNIFKELQYEMVYKN
jgi:hypothetical protein